MSKPIPPLAIILVNWNGLDYTLKCLDSLRSATFQDFQIIVVDNGSEMSQVAQLRKVEGIYLIELPKNTGFTGGNNEGIGWALAQGFEFIMLLNNDTEVDPGFIEPLIQAVQQNDTGAVQPKIYNLYDRNMLWSMGGYIHKYSGKPVTIGSYVQDDGTYNATQQVDWISGCCILTKNAVFREIGILDDKFFALCEDVDWSLRVKKAGYTLQVVPSSRIYHAESASTTSKVKGKEGYRSPFRVFLNIRNHIYLLRKHRDQYYVLSAIVSQAIKISAYCGYFILRGRWQKLKATLRGFREGITMKVSSIKNKW